MVEKAAQDIRDATLKHQELVDKTCALVDISWVKHGGFNMEFVVFIGVNRG